MDSATEPALPTTIMSGWSLRRAARPSLTIWWSSTIMTWIDRAAAPTRASCADAPPSPSAPRESGPGCTSGWPAMLRPDRYREPLRAEIRFATAIALLLQAAVADFEPGEIAPADHCHDSLQQPWKAVKNDAAGVVS